MTTAGFSRTRVGNGGGFPRIPIIGALARSSGAAGVVLRNSSRGGVRSASSARLSVTTPPSDGPSRRASNAANQSNPSTRRGIAATLAPLPQGIIVPLARRPRVTAPRRWSTATAQTTCKMRPANGGISSGRAAHALGHESRNANGAAADSSQASTTPARTAPSRAGSSHPTPLTLGGSGAAVAEIGAADGAYCPTVTSRSGIPKPRSVTARGRRSRTSWSIASSWKRSWVARFFRVRTSTTSTASATTTGPRTSNCGSRSNRPANGRTNRSTALPAPARSGVFTLA